MIPFLLGEQLSEEEARNVYGLFFGLLSVEQDGAARDVLVRQIAYEAVALAEGGSPEYLSQAFLALARAASKLRSEEP